MTEERDDVVVLVDENGDEVEFEHLDTLEMNGNEYVVLLPVDAEEEDEDEDEENDSDEVLILKIEHNEEGEDSFISVDDDNELNMVFEEFRVRMKDEYDFSE